MNFCLRASSTTRRPAYYNRARYLNTSTGRFWSMDTYDGDLESPLSLHKYMYGNSNPVNNIDPTGNQIDDIVGAFAAAATLDAMSTVTLNTFATVTHFPFHAVQVSSRNIVQYDNIRGDLAAICQGCYGAERQYLYRLTDPRGVPFTDRALVRENNQIISTSDPSAAFRTGEGWTTSGYFMDTVGYGRYDRPFPYVFTKTEQTFTVLVNGNGYPLSTKVNQYTEKRNGQWILEAVVTVP